MNFSENAFCFLACMLSFLCVPKPFLGMMGEKENKQTSCEINPANLAHQVVGWLSLGSQGGQKSTQPSWAWKVPGWGRGAWSLPHCHQSRLSLEAREPPGSITNGTPRTSSVCDTINSAQEFQLWCLRLRIQDCLCGGSDSISSPGTPLCHKCSQKIP